MKNVALALALVLVAPAAAHAGNSFISLGLGATASTSLNNFDGSGTAASLYVGQKFGMFGLEAGLSRYGLQGPQASWTNVGLGAGGRFTLPIGPMLGASLHAGIERTWMNANGGSNEFSGTGWMGGLGLEYKLDFGLASGAVWADYTRHDASFVNDRAQTKGNVDLIQLGITIGF